MSAQEVETDPTVSSLRQLAATPTRETVDRATISEFLARDDVRGAASARGIDLQRVERAAATMDDRAAADVADRIRTIQDEAVLAGGDRIVISATAVIIILLVLILLSV